MKIARVIAKQSTLSELRKGYPQLFEDERIIIEIQFDGNFNKGIAIDQIMGKSNKDGDAELVHR